jgi:hypothetical protein
MRYGLYCAVGFDANTALFITFKSITMQAHSIYVHHKDDKKQTYRIDAPSRQKAYIEACLQFPAAKEIIPV